MLRKSPALDPSLAILLESLCHVKFFSPFHPSPSTTGQPPSLAIISFISVRPCFFRVSVSSLPTWKDQSSIMHFHQIVILQSVQLHTNHFLPNRGNFLPVIQWWPHSREVVNYCDTFDIHLAFCGLYSDPLSLVSCSTC